MPHTIERASTGRAKCRACGQLVAKGELRLGERLPNPFAEAEGAETTHWFHLLCAAYKRPQPLLEALAATTEVIEDRSHLEAEAKLGIAHHRSVRVDAASRAPSGRAACRACKQSIDKGSWRIGLVFYEDGRFAPSGYIHLTCAAGYLETAEVIGRIRHFSPALSAEELAEIDEAVRGDAETGSRPRSSREPVS